jgi:hypothetical protein
MIAREPTPTMPKDPPLILKVSKPSMLQVAQLGTVDRVNPAFGSLCQAGGNKENIPKAEYANIWYLELTFTITAKPKEMLGI